MKSALSPALLLAALAIGCGGTTPSSGGPLPIDGSRQAESHAVQGLDFSATAIAARTERGHLLVAGPGHAATVSLGIGRENSTVQALGTDGVEAPLEPAIAAAVLTGGRGVVLWPSAALAVEGGTLGALAGGMGLGTGLAAAAGSGEVLWLAGPKLVRLDQSRADAVSIDGVSGAATALAIGDDGTAWLATGDQLHAVTLAAGGDAAIREVVELEIGEIHALTAAGGAILAGGASGLAIRDPSGAWRSYQVEAPVTALAAAGERVFALIGEELVVKDGERFSRLEIDSGEPIAGLAAEESGAALLARGSAIERWSPDRLIDLVAPTSSALTAPVRLLVHLDRAADVDQLSASIADRMLEVATATSADFTIAIDPALLAEGPAELIARAQYKDGAVATAKLALTIGPARGPSWSRDIRPWAEGTCSCHFSGSPGAPQLTSADEWRRRGALLIRRVVEQQSPTMPPPDATPRPTEGQRAMLRRWLEGHMDD